MNSMTGFGAASLSQDGREISIEIKSVNHRFLDVTLKLPKSLGFLENAFREQIGQQLSRGHVELYINYQNQREDAKTVRVDVPLLQQYLAAFEQIKQYEDIAPTLRPGEIMHMQDVLIVTQEQEDQGAIRELAQRVLAQALENLGQMRGAEGNKLRQDLALRIGNLQTIFEQVQTLAFGVSKVYADKLFQRIDELLGEVEVDEQRLANEIAIFADKSNIDEEIARFHSHISQFLAMLEQGEPVGRKMDFALQELNREVNTIGSKANNVQITNGVLELKAELEKIREQVQNIE